MGVFVETSWIRGSIHIVASIRGRSRVACISLALSGPSVKVEVPVVGPILSTAKLSEGLNYGSVPGLKPGRQYIEVVEIDSQGKWEYQQTRTGDVSVTNDAGNGLCNYNYLVYGLKAGRNN